MRRSHPYWGARRIAFELVRKGVERVPSESAVYRCLVRAAVIDPVSRQRRRETWKRWERGAPMELWHLDVVHGFLWLGAEREISPVKFCQLVRPE
jgi:hypothetical protein